jgi:predicted transcriptional regulator YheO
MNSSNLDTSLNCWFSSAQAIVQLFQPHCEVVIHDLKANTIAGIFNSFSKREIGDESLLEENLELTSEVSVIGPYPRVNWDGRKLKSITAVLRDSRNTPIGLMCINFDLSFFESIKGFISGFLEQNGLQDPPKMLFQNDWREKINRYIEEFLKHRGQTLPTLTKKGHLALVRQLHQDGAFEGKNAANYIGQILGISRATVYNYLKSEVSERDLP